MDIIMGCSVLTSGCVPMHTHNLENFMVTFLKWTLGTAMLDHICFPCPF